MGFSSTMTPAFVVLAATMVHQTQAADRPQDSLDPSQTVRIDFVRDIQPVFAKHCYRCHGAKKREGGFRLDLRESALTGGDSGESIVPGQSESSMLMDYVAGVDPDIVMPPEGERLSPSKISLLRVWIDQGANWPDRKSSEGEAVQKHWATSR